MTQKKLTNGQVVQRVRVKSSYANAENHHLIQAKLSSNFGGIIVSDGMLPAHEREMKSLKKQNRAAAHARGDKFDENMYIAQSELFV
jgi:hypothetical protein